MNEPFFTLPDFLQQEGGAGRRVGIDVYTDGSCVGNGCRDAMGGIGVFFGPNDPYNVSEPIFPPSSSSSRLSDFRVTSQSMELAACLKAIQQSLARSDKSEGQLHIRIYTDSDYVIYAMKSDVSWQKKQLPMDRAYIKKLLKAVEDVGGGGSSGGQQHQYGVTFVHISAHQSAPMSPYLTGLAHWFGNRDADALASRAAQAAIQEAQSRSKKKQKQQMSPGKKDRKKRERSG